MKIRIGLGLLLGGLLALPAFADQFQYNTLPDAVKAMRVVEGVRQVKYFCAPCNEETAKTVKLNNTSIEPVWDRQQPTQTYKDGAKTYWQIFINEDAVDLAYVYVPVDGKWRNLAMMIGQTPSDVPEFIQ